MKRFLCDTLLTIIPATALLAIGMVVLPAYTAKGADNEYSDKKSYLETHMDDIALLIAGHSQSECGIDPSVLDSCYNLAMLARISHYDASLLERYVPQMPHLQAVIFPLICEYEPGTVLQKRDWRQRLKAAYKYQWAIDPPAELDTIDNWCQRAYGILEQAFRLHPIRRNVDYDSLGFIAGNTSVGNGNNVYEAPGTGPMVKASLRRMARVCGEHGVRLIVVTMPCNSTYRAAHGDCDDRLQRLMDEVAGEYPAVEYRCYLNDERFSDSLFSDQSHMNQAGATAFALRLKEDFGL